jgi:hypothetical protein
MRADMPPNEYYELFTFNRLNPKSLCVASLQARRAACALTCLPMSTMSCSSPTDYTSKQQALQPC